MLADVTGVASCMEEKMSTPWRYAAATLAGLATAIGCVAGGIAATSFAPEGGFFGSMIGALVGLPLGGWVAARLARPGLASSSAPWRVLLVIAPGVWLALGAWIIEGRRSGTGSEYFLELIGPGLFGILIGFAGALFGSRAPVPRAHLPR